MIGKLISVLFGDYFFDKKGISKGNVVAHSYTPSLEKDVNKNAKLTSNSRVCNFFYWLYSEEKTNGQS